MSSTINGHTLTPSQRRTLDELRDFLHENGGDSHAGPTTSPKGDGQSFDVYEIWGRSNQATAHRRNVWAMQQAGVLRACEIGYDPTTHKLKLSPFSEIAANV
jgi:hypothetical protein